MDRFYKILFIVVVGVTLFIVGYTFNNTVVKSDFVMIEDEATAEETVSEPPSQVETATSTLPQEEEKADLK